MLVRYKKDSKPSLGQGTLYFMPVRTAIFMGETVDNMPSYIPEVTTLTAIQLRWGKALRSTDLAGASNLAIRVSCFTG
jgi:hypothetical protein